jgi:hypothetical protein
MSKSNRIITVLYLLFFLLFTTYAQGVKGDDLSVEASGKGNNEAKALIAAKRNAIEKAVKIELKSWIEITIFENNAEKAITKSLGALKKYDILSKGKNPEGIFEISIKALVSSNSLRKNLTSLNITLESMEKPKAMVVVIENNVDIKYQSTHAAEDAIIAFLKYKHNFEIVDPTIVASIKASTEKMAILSRDEKGASSIGTEYGAEFIITGNATSTLNEEVSDKSGGHQFVQAEVKLKAINCTIGKTIASGEANEVKVHISPKIAGAEAIGTACNKILEKNIFLILEDWNTQKIKGVPLTVTIKNVNSVRIQNVVCRTIKEMPGVVSISEPAWNEKDKLLQIEVNYKGNTNEFCTKSNGYKMITGGGSFALAGQNGTQISLMLQAK